MFLFNILQKSEIGKGVERSLPLVKSENQVWFCDDILGG